jgi:hypothetical protein
MEERNTHLPAIGSPWTYLDAKFTSGTDIYLGGATRAPPSNSSAERYLSV